MLQKTKYIFLAAVGLLAFFTDWYAFQGVKALVSGTSFGTIISIGFWVAFTGLNAVLIYLLAGVKGRDISPFAKKFFHIYLTIFVTKLTFILVLLGEDVYRTLASVINYFSGAEEGIPFRSRIVSQIGLVIASVPFVSFIYGITKGKYAYKVKRQTLYFEDLPDKFDGFTITQISDVHAGSLDNPKAVQKGIELINAQNSDLFVFTGDFVNNESSELEPWIDTFKQIKAPYGKFSVLGNHDYGDYVSWKSIEDKYRNLQKLKKHHSDIGFRLLLDENIEIKKDNQRINLLGVENWGIGFGQKGDLNKALVGVEKSAFKVLLSHDPTHWDSVVKKHSAPVHLTLSGHTHGMQFGIELPWFSWSPVKYRYAHWAGLKKENEKHLYINRGFGFIGFSGRVGIWPEITVFELKKLKSGMNVNPKSVNKEHKAA